MARKTIPALILVLIVLACLLIFQQVKVSRLQKRIAKYERKELQDKIREFISSFAIPSEALYFDKPVRQKVAKLRFDSCMQHDTPYFLPYASILSFLRTDFLELTKSDYDWQEKLQNLELDKLNSGYIDGHSFEKYWLWRTRESLDSFASSLEDYQRLGYQEELATYFKDHPDEFEQFVKPWITRALEAYEPWLKMSACRVLLALGDKTDNIKSALGQVISGQNPYDAEKAKELAAKYNLELKPPTDS